MRPIVSSALVERELRRHHFAILATTGDDGTPDSAGVSYGVSPVVSDLVIFVMTRRHLRKARDIATRPEVSLVVPLERRLLRFVPPATIQLRGRAELLDWGDPEGTAVFARFWLGRRILDAYRASYRRGERRICFIKITPAANVRTYMLGSRLWDIGRRMESGAATARLLARRVG